MYAEIEAALQDDVFPTSEVVSNEVVFTVDTLDIPAAPNSPSIEQPPSLELKQLPENLKYAYFILKKHIFDPGIKDEGTNKNFKFNEHYPKLLYESPTLEEENVEDLSLGKAIYAIIYPP